MTINEKHEPTDMSAFSFFLAIAEEQVRQAAILAERGCKLHSISPDRTREWEKKEA